MTLKIFENGGKKKKKMSQILFQIERIYFHRSIKGPKILTMISHGLRSSGKRRHVILEAGPGSCGPTVSCAVTAALLAACF